MVEMTETANILNRATERSFIIFDEIGRGTATYDGMAIAQAVLEFLNNLGPRTLFATHYHELTALVGDGPDQLGGVSCLTIDVREHNNEIIFMHKIVPGVANRSYGIHVAKMAGMPASVVVLGALESRHGGAQCAPTTASTPVSAAPVTPAAPTPRPAPRGRVNQSDVAPQLSLFG